MPPSIPPPRVADCHCSAVRRAARQITRFYDAHLHPTGLRITQFLILAMLNEVPGVPIIDLADRLDIEQTAMGKMVATLQRDGLVRVQRSATDGRSRTVELTPEGRALFDTAAPLWQAAQAAFAAQNGTAGVDALRPGFAPAHPLLE
jgi:DNA-binding MarR family transcriptional regulator